MEPVRLIAIDRPGLAPELARRGLAIGEGTDCALVVSRPPAAYAAVPVLVEAATYEQAAALLDGGADDVVVAGDPDTLVAARAAALLRRGRPGVLRIGNLVIDAVAQAVSRDGRPVPMLPREYALLLVLARNAGTTVTRTQLREALWESRIDAGSNVIAVHMSRLRRRLGHGRGTPTIATDRGSGYRLDVPQIAS